MVVYYRDMATQIRIEPILPKRPNYPLSVIGELEKQLSDTMRGPVRSTLVYEISRRMHGWKQSRRPDVSGQFSRRAYKGNMTGFSLTVGPSGPNKKFWVFVSGGTVPHEISPKRPGGYMTIRGGVGGYRPRTLPGDYYGGPGDYDQASTFKTRNTVNHPGIQAREFEKEIVAKHERAIVVMITQAVQRALK